MFRIPLLALLFACLAWMPNVQAAQPYVFTATLDFEEAGGGFLPVTESLFAPGATLTGRFDYAPGASQDFSGPFGFPTTLSGYSQALSNLEVEVSGVSVGAGVAPVLMGDDLPFPAPLFPEIAPFDLFFVAAGERDDASGVAGSDWRDAVLDGGRGRISMVRMFLLAPPEFQNAAILPDTLRLDDFDHEGDSRLAGCPGCAFWNGTVQRHVVLTVTRDDGSLQFAWFRIDALTSADADGDGIVDDFCPDTSADAVVDARGCSVAQTCSCDAFRNHGQRMACVTRAVEDLVQIGALDDRERGRSVSAFAKDRSCHRRGR